jgi:hypothetical protein
MKASVVMNSKAGVLTGGSPDQTVRQIEQLFAAARIVTQVAKSRRVDWTIGKMSRSGL